MRESKTLPKSDQLPSIPRTLGYSRLAMLCKLWNSIISHHIMSGYACNIDGSLCSTTEGVR